MATKPSRRPSPASTHNRSTQSKFTRRISPNLNRHINFERESEKTNSRKDATDVICIQCKEKFTLPFKPRRPDVYCDKCFKKKNKKSM